MKCFNIGTCVCIPELVLYDLYTFPCMKMLHTYIMTIQFMVQLCIEYTHTVVWKKFSMKNFFVRSRV